MSVNCACERITYPFVLPKEGIVMFCELKIWKLWPSCLYNLCSGLRRIRSQYFSDKSNFAYYGNTCDCLPCMTVEQVKMADCNRSKGESPELLSQNTSNEVNYLCKNCQDRESQLKEFLDELNSAHVVIRILQSERITCKTSTTMCDVNLATSEESHNRKKTDEWITTAHKNKNAKL